MKLTTLVGGQRIMAHEEYDCKGNFCCIHNPSDNHMSEWPQNWRGDRGIMERICPHGVGHPDFDDLSEDKTHGCDFCCIGLEVPGFQGRYIATWGGDIYSTVSNKLLKPHEKDGYLFIQLCHDGGRSYCGVHRLVAKAFLPNPEGKRTVNHKDSDRKNNCVSNLEWATDSENIKHCYDSGRRPNQAGVAKKNGKQGSSTTPDVVQKIRSDYATGCFTYIELSKKYGLHRESVGRIVRRQVWKEV